MIQPAAAEATLHATHTTLADCVSTNGSQLVCSGTAGIGLGILAFVYLAVVVLSIVATVKVVTKAGYSGWWTLVAIVPVVNLVMWLVFAFSKWPVVNEVERLRAQLGGRWGYGPPAAPAGGWGPGGPGFGGPASGAPGSSGPGSGAPGFGAPGSSGPGVGGPGSSSYGRAAPAPGSVAPPGGPAHVSGPGQWFATDSQTSTLPVASPPGPSSAAPSPAPPAGAPPVGGLSRRGPADTDAPLPSFWKFHSGPVDPGTDAVSPGAGAPAAPSPATTGTCGTRPVEQPEPSPGAEASPPAGWYPAPDGRQRYWDGSAWTDRFA